MCSSQPANPAVHADARGRSIADPPRQTCPARGYLLGVGPVPEDGVAVGHHFGTGLLAKNTHQQHQADEEDHFHLQHHYSETSARIPLRRRVSQSSCTGASTGTGDGSHSHVAPCLWRRSGTLNKYKRAQHRKHGGDGEDVTIRGDT